MKRLLLAFVGFLGASQLHAGEERPWYGNVLEFEAHSSYAYTDYSRVDAIGGSVASNGADHKLALGLSISPLPHWSTELELQLGDTASGSPNLHYMFGGVRYLWLEDLVGDPVALSTGISGRFSTLPGRSTLSNSIHSALELEAHVAIGREIAARDDWLLRGWLLGALGGGTKGSSWTRANVGLDWHIAEEQQLSLELLSQLGLGSQTLNLAAPFLGYSTIRHRFIDLRASYSLPLSDIATLKASYAYRVWAENAPLLMHCARLELLFPFSF